MHRKVTFDRDGLTLVGNLFAPDNFDDHGHYQAVIAKGSFTSVKEQMAGTYAQKFANEGFVAFAFDYAHYGESAGEPRQLERTHLHLSALLSVRPREISSCRVSASWKLCPTAQILMLSL
jgi:hypothetical protein